MALQVVLSLLVVGSVVAALAYPIFNGVDEPEADAVRAELEDAKQAKYREIRDAELDFRAGKLTEDEWRETDRDLRREAMLILAKLDAGSVAFPSEPAAAPATEKAPG
jgi:hypothetical protein